LENFQNPSSLKGNLVRILKGLGNFLPPRCYIFAFFWTWENPKNGRDQFGFFERFQRRGVIWGLNSGEKGLRWVFYTRISSKKERKRGVYGI